MTSKNELKGPVKSAFTKKLTKLMADNDLTSPMLAEFAGLDRDSVYVILRDDHVPNALTLCLFARVFRCTLDDLIPPEAYR